MRLLDEQLARGPVGADPRVDARLLLPVVEHRVAAPPRQRLPTPVLRWGSSAPKLACTGATQATHASGVKVCLRTVHAPRMHGPRQPRQEGELAVCSRASE